MAYVDSGYLITDTQSSDLEPIELETVATLPSNTTTDVTVYQDTDSDGTAENSQAVTVTGGTETHQLDGFAVGGDVWLRIDLGTSDTDVTPEFDAATVEVASPPPASVTATATDVREVSLDWDDVSTADEYNVYRDTTTGAVDSGDLVGTVSTTTFTDSDSTLLDGDQYYYAVTSVTGGVESDDATETDVITQLPPVENLAVDSVSGRYATLSWTDPSNNADHFEVLLREDDEGLYGIDGETGSTSYETTELLDGQQYGATVETWTADAVSREGLDGALRNWWPMTDRYVSDGALLDVGAANLNGDINGPATGVGGPVDTVPTAVEFDRASGDYITLGEGEDTLFTNAQEWTVAMWAMAYSFPSSTNSSDSHTLYSPVNTYLFLQLGDSAPTDEFSLRVNLDTDGWTTVLQSGPVNADQWYHVAMTHDPSTGFEMFLDGVSVDTSSNSDTLGSDSEPGLFGGRDPDSRHWDGRAADPRVYERVLSDAEIADLANGVFV